MLRKTSNQKSLRAIKKEEKITKKNKKVEKL